MSSIPHLPTQTGAVEETPIATTTNATSHIEAGASPAPLRAAETGVSAPGGWIEDEPNVTNDFAATATAVGNNIVDAANKAFTVASEAAAKYLPAAGEAAAKYLPTSVVGTVAPHAPESMKPALDAAIKDDDNATSTTGSQAPPLTTEARNYLDIPEHSLTEHPLPTGPAGEPTPSLTTAATTSSQVPPHSLTDHPIPSPDMQPLETTYAPAAPATSIGTAQKFLDSSVPTPDPAAPAGNAINDENAPSSTLSVKSGVIGSGPQGATPGPIPPPKDDLGDVAYLARHIRPQASSKDVNANPNTTGGSPAPGSRFTEESDNAAIGTPHHGRRASDTSGSETGSPKEKVKFSDRIKGEMKVLQGKWKKDDQKVQEGKALLGQTN